MIQSFEIPGRLPGTNEYQDECRKNARAGGRMKRDATDMVAWYAKAARIKPMLPPVSVHIEWVEPNMRRDKDNIRGGAKFILDGLQEAGVIGNDNWKWIEGISDEYKVNKAKPHITVTLETKEEE